MASLYELADELKELMEVSLVTKDEMDTTIDESIRRVDILYKTVYLLGFIEALKERKDD